MHKQPFQAYFRRGLPIYSTKAVRFRMGHPRSPIGIGNDSRDEFEAGHECTDSTFIWTYTSPQFPMAQVEENVAAAKELEIFGKDEKSLLEIEEILKPVKNQTWPSGIQQS
ncbi:hypothetical protein Vadar_009602 [Vaccinium darrowii]|uniref:Uncharacterized protein n=1 Tax=Vaccinium darrowii TaxID=229202 RepID=A0ACB7ZIL2_9ERIC|nr:hypothetical protein Vadar_009602 [Vaccinium darrowii]